MPHNENVKCLQALLFVILLFPAASAGSKHKTPAPLPKLDPDYASALNAANHFLQAWQSGDHEAGLLMLSDSAKQHTTEETSYDFFLPGPHPAYEIGRGTKLKAGRYSFPVVLYETKTGHAPRRRLSHIIVTRTGEKDWAVDKLP